jgi:hypothetical protein
MGNTFTFTARNVEDLNQVITFTLQDQWMQVGSGPFQETLEAAIEKIGVDTGDEEPEGVESAGKLWIKPLAVSLFERGLGKFHVNDVVAKIEDDRIRVRAWYRTGRLALLPITLMNGRVDNPKAAHAFVEELDVRKAEAKGKFGFLGILDYWGTWIFMGISLAGLFGLWNHFSSQDNQGD